jgi:hypothetical protein
MYERAGRAVRRARRKEAWGTMKRVLTLLLLAGAFLGGYYLGRLPNSPDIFAWGRDTFDGAVEMGREAEEYLAADSGRAEPDAPQSPRVPSGAYLFHRDADSR